MEITEGHWEPSGGDGHVHYLSGGDDGVATSRCQSRSDSPH